jgi:hypothetical protein
VSAHWAATRLIADRPDRLPPLLVTLGHSPLLPADIAEAIGIELLGTVPLDPVAASMVSGHPGRPRVLARSMLISRTSRLARVLEARCRELMLGSGADDVAASEPAENCRDAG